MIPPALCGTFRGRVVTEWLDSKHEDRRMRLHPDTDLTFERPTGEIVSAMPGLIFDGASIPVLFWALIGSPFTGKYRKAAVIHDTLCFIRDRPAAEAHWIFREGLRALGVGRVRARLMYLALVWFGSKW
jgi:hypothetical protein